MNVLINKNSAQAYNSFDKRFDALPMRIYMGDYYGIQNDNSRFGTITANVSD